MRVSGESSTLMAAPTKPQVPSVGATMSSHWMRVPGALLTKTTAWPAMSSYGRMSAVQGWTPRMVRSGLSTVKLPDVLAGADQDGVAGALTSMAAWTVVYVRPLPQLGPVLST